MPEGRIQRTREAYEPPKPKPPQPAHPTKNLGPHVGQQHQDGLIVTQHHRGAKT